jgi:hypothetical protein
MAPGPFADSALLDELGANGCLTGDCPHQNQSECDKALADHLREALERRGDEWRCDDCDETYTTAELTITEGAGQPACPECGREVGHL